MQSLEFSDLSKEIRSQLRDRYQFMINHADVKTGQADLIEEALAMLEGLDQSEFGEDIQEVFNRSISLLASPDFELTPETYAALDYLVDPYDLIPDNVPGYGVLDDAYVLALMLHHIEPGSLRISEFDIEEQARLSDPSKRYAIDDVHPEQLVHFATKARYHNLFSGREVKAFSNISAKLTRGSRVSIKQLAYLDKLYVMALDAGVKEAECPKDRCEFCHVGTVVEPEKPREFSYENEFNS